VDLTPTGNPGVDLVKAINAAKIQGAQNALANQILNTQMPPRAGLVAPGVNPQTGQANVLPAGLPTVGTPPQSGGMGELQLRQQLAQQGLANQLKQAQIARELALTRSATTGRGTGQGSAAGWAANLGGGGQGGQGGRGAQGGRGGKPAAYVAGSGDVTNDPGTDNFDQIRADADAQYGKGAFDTLTKNLSNLRPDGKGNMVLMKPRMDTSDSANPKPMLDPNGNPVMEPVLDKNGLPAYSIPATDAQYWGERYNATRIRQGQGYIGNLTGINPNSGEPGGTQANPVRVDNNLTLRSLPFNTWMLMDDGSVRQKQPLSPGQAPTGQAAAGQAPTGQAPTGQAPAGQAPTAAAAAPPAQAPVDQTTTAPLEQQPDDTTNVGAEPEGETGQGATSFNPVPNPDYLAGIDRTLQKPQDYWT
jgi:hypothetical protein